MLDTHPVLVAPTETGALGVGQLKRIWSRALAARSGAAVADATEQHFELQVLFALGVGVEQAQQYLLREGPSFEEFERWVAATTGGVERWRVERINAAVAGAEPPAEVQRSIAEIEAMSPVLDEDDFAHWAEHGYTILHEAVPEEARRAAEQAIWDHLGARADDPESWYVANDHGMMVQFFQHPAFEAVRWSKRIHKAFAQIWGAADLWPSCDRVGFNVPERPGWMFRGPHMHWDVSLARPIPFGTQGILYLTDTPAEQGAFTCVPGFHRKIEAWLDGLPAGADPRAQDLHALGSQPIAGCAGDLVIWDNRLPHGPRPNRGARPRIVQYLNLCPARIEVRDEWV